MKTVITYHGGKQLLSSTINELLPEAEIFVEPFIGGGAVFFSRDKSKSQTEVINDIDKMIAIFYRVLKTDFDALKARIDTTLYDRSTHEYALRIRKFAGWHSDLDIGWAFFCLSALGFSGTLESFGTYKKGRKAATFHNKKKLFTKELAQRFDGVLIESMDAVKLIQLKDSQSTLYYLDPPYINTCQSHYRGYTEDHYRELLETLSNIEGKFLLSSFESEILNEFIKKNSWYSKTITMIKPSSRNKDGSKKTKVECLTANFKI